MSEETKSTRTGFRLFLFSMSLLALVFLAAALLSANPENRKYAIYTAPGNIICIVLSFPGLYFGITAKGLSGKEQTKRIIGLAGNSLIILFEIFLVVAAVLIAAGRA